MILKRSCKDVARMLGIAHSQIGRPRKHVGRWNSVKMHLCISPMRCLPNVEGEFKTGK